MELTPDVDLLHIPLTLYPQRGSTEVSQIYHRDAYVLPKRLMYHSRFILKGVAEVSQIFLRDAQILLKLLN
jgi:hypothetical protein